MSEDFSSIDIWSNLRNAEASPEPDKNFTWEHFFVKHCGILIEDAQRYEKSLISHRMDPLDTLLESIDLIIEYGRIPIGDKIKISKTIEKAKECLDDERQAKADARKVVGLEKYNEFEAGVILELAGGDSEYHIEYGIEQFEDFRQEWSRAVSIAMIKNPKASEGYKAGMRAGRAVSSPVLRLLQFFGYETFDYTHSKHGKSKAIVPNLPTSADAVTNDILFGNLKNEGENNAPDHMYS